MSKAFDREGAKRTVPRHIVELEVARQSGLRSELSAGGLPDSARLRNPCCVLAFDCNDGTNRYTSFVWGGTIIQDPEDWQKCEECVWSGKCATNITRVDEG